MLLLKDRIKKVRKALDLTQQEFGLKIGSTQNAIGNYETGHRNPSSSVINNICKTFNVDETWLRTGEGEMFCQDEESIVDRLCAELHADELETEIIRAYFRIDERIRLPFLRRLIQEVQERPAAPVVVSKNETTTPAEPDSGKDISVPTQPDRTEADIAAEQRKLTIDEQVELYRQQLLSEEERASQALSVRELGMG